MGIGLRLQRLCRVQMRRLLLITGMMVAFVVVLQLYALPYENYISFLLHESKGTVLMTLGSTTFSDSSKLVNPYSVHDVGYSTIASETDEEIGYKGEEEENKENAFAPVDGGEMDNSFEIGRRKNSSHNYFRSLDNSSTTQEKVLVSIEQFKKSDNNPTRDNDPQTSTYSTRGEFSNQASFGSLPVMSLRFSTSREYLDSKSSISVSCLPANMSSVCNEKQDMKTQDKDLDTELLQTASIPSTNNSMMTGNWLQSKRMKPTSISDMTSLLLQTSVSTNSKRPRWSSARDKELQHARLQIENAQIIMNTTGLHASLFRNVSMFRRSYELMERMLKIYIYSEGDKPIFHQPKLRGIYASEGWFMKLMEGNKQFVVRDPKKAHLFYLPFSSQRLREVLHQPNFASQKDLEKHMDNYIDKIAKRLRFWNRTSGADHFLVACHDWAPRFTRKNMASCIRALCNSNVARGFKIGKDVVLPVTYVRTAQNPLRDLGGYPPLERPILAFFAGGMHGYLRPTLLQYWNNKEPDIKVFGPMPRDVEGKTRYRELMKSSKYCICARGYEVHTPRVVESIYYECVPVIISDNYVPPLFEVLDWEAFAVFILEEEIPNLRNILLSIPEEKYLAMQHRVKMVQQHFLWHKKPVKYDLFHMILHSIWYNRVFQVKPG